VFEQTRDIEFEVLALDNASEDGTAEMIGAEFERVRLIASESNLGFARASNRLATQARGEFLLLLNPDTIVHDGAVQKLVAFAREHPEGGLYGGRTLSPSGALNPSSCWGAPSLWSLTCFALGLSALGRHNATFDPESLGSWQRDSVREVDIVTGCLALIRRDLWEQLEGFDGRFWMYGEDADLSIRVAARGYRPMITPSATITHVVGASSRAQGPKRALVMHAKASLLVKHWSPPRARLGVWLLTVGVGLRAMLDTVRTRMRHGSGASSDWSYSWQHRSEWQSGFPDAPDAA
jgi:GT2 family glycosyltransferase